MAYPPAYTRTYSFTDFETTNPGEPKPGNKLDSEYDAVANALTGTQNALALIQRADGALANESVGVDQLQADLFDGIADDAVADAEAAAAAAASSASAAAASASAAASSATASSTSAGVAAGAASAAGIAQGVAQTAATDAGTAADDAGDAADAAELAANTTTNSVAQAQLHEEMAFKWAEYLAAPVAPAPPGWPEAVDDGMFSSKWWALRSRDYNSVHHIDLGTSGADIGAAFDTWDLTHDLPIGLIYATWGTPPLEYALTDPSDPSDPDSWTQISGGPGPAGPPNSLTIGSVVSGTPAAATITGTAPNQVLSLTIPPGATGATGATGPTGATGAAGPPNTLSIGTVTTGAPGSPAGATITGAAPSQTLSLTIPRGDVGATGATGATGPAGPTNYANPTAVIGLTAVNGSGSNTMRSDAAPPLSQAIVPTWTGKHTFNGTVNLAGPVEASGVEGLDGQVLASQGAGLPLVFRNAGSGSIELGYNFAVAVGTADPGNQKLSLNSAVYASVNQIQFDDLAFGNFDAQTILSLLTSGNRIYIQARADATRAVVYEVTGVGTDNGGHWSIPVSIIASRGALFAANADLTCVFILSSSSISVANPTATIGLTAVNGSATTAMRSDAAPPLSVAIAPTWSGRHIFGGSDPQIQLTNPAAPLDTKFSSVRVTSAGTFGIYSSTDAASGTVVTPAFLAARLGAAWNLLTFGSATDNPAYTFAGTGVTSHGGPVVVGSAIAYGDRIQMRNTAVAGVSNYHHYININATTLKLYAYDGTNANVGTVQFQHAQVTIDGAVVVGGATGGSQGAGTVNATGLFINGVAVGGGGSVANPTATIGLAAVNGVATSAIRSDGAPALSQAIVPTWTAQHIFSKTGHGTSSAIRLVANDPAISFRDADNATDTKEWEFICNGLSFQFGLLDDAGAGFKSGLRFSRSAAAFNLLEFGNLTDNPPYTFLGTGNMTLGGAITVAGPMNMNAVRPGINFNETDQALDEKRWRLDIQSKTLSWQITDDAVTVARDILSVARGTGTVVSGLAFGNTTDNPNFVFNGTGLGTVSGTWTFNLTPVVPNNSFTYAKLQDVSATSRVLGRITAGAGDIEELTGANLATILGSALAAGANPTASVGTAAVNGSAVTFMRSDAAPALSQAIIPTWTGLHTFTNGQTNSSADVVIAMNETDQGADGKLWWMRGTSGAWQLQTRTDAGAAGQNAISIARSGTTVGVMEFGNATANNAFSFLGTGAVTIGGALIQTGGACQIRYTETDQAADEKSWTQIINGKVFILEASTDSFASHSQFLNVARGTATAITSMAFGNVGDNPTYSFLGTGATTFNGGVVLGAPTGGNKGVGTINATGIYINNVAVTAPPAAGNPTATVGTSAVNGSASTFMRSDGAPAINLTINPSWSGVHTFTAIGSIGGGPIALVHATSTGISYNLSGQPTDGKVWQDSFTGTTRQFNIYNDALSSGKGWMAVTRLLNVVTGLTFGNAVDNPTYTFLGTGTVSAGSFTTTSARAVKRETGKPSRVRDMLSRLRPLLYRLLDGDDREQLGLIAEEVHEVCPQLSDGKTVAYDRLAILLLAAWQEDQRVSVVAA